MNAWNLHSCHRVFTAPATLVGGAKEGAEDAARLGALAGSIKCGVDVAGAILCADAAHALGRQPRAAFDEAAADITEVTERARTAVFSGF